jgi:hypothetical protein
MDATIMLFVGADNETGELDQPRIAKIVAKRHDGFTMTQARGYWRGMAEDSVMILISGPRDDIMETARTLKSELRQDAIGIQEMPALAFV